MVFRALIPIVLLLGILGCPPGSSGSGGGLKVVAVDDNAAGGFFHDFGEAIIRDGTGRFLVAGSSISLLNDSDMIIWAIGEKGSRDPLFGTGGVALAHDAAGGADDDFGFGMALDSAGRIIVAGASRNLAMDLDMVIWRYDSTGMLDPSFGTAGVAVHNGAAGGLLDDRALDVVVDPSGRIIAVGESENFAGNLDMVIWVYDGLGVLDSSFGTGGIVVGAGDAGGTGDDFARAILVDGSDRILVTGASTNPTNDLDMALWRFLPDGSPDASFAASGFTSDDDIAGGGSDDVGEGIALDLLDEILVAGWSISPGLDPDMALWKYREDGTLNPKFKKDGRLTDDRSGGIDQAFDVAVTSYGRFMIAGVTGESGVDGDVAIWKLNGDGGIDAFASKDGSAGGTGGDYGTSIAPGGRGGVVFTGASENRFGDFDMVIWRR